MKDKLLIIINIKKTALKLDKIIENFNRNELILRDNIKKEMYKLLRNAYKANIFIEERYQYQKEMLVSIKMLDFYLINAYHKKLISKKQITQYGDFLLQIYKLLQGWIKNEKGGRNCGINVNKTRKSRRKRKNKRYTKENIGTS